MIKAVLALFVLLMVPVPPQAGQPRLAAPTVAEEALLDELLRLPTDLPRRQDSRILMGKYSRESPPPDNASLDVLGLFWAGPGELLNADRLVLPDKTRERLLEAVMAKPSMARYPVQLLPRNTAVHDRIKQLYDEYKQQLGPAWSDRVRTYLMRHTAYLRDELVREASAATDQAGFVDHQEEMEAFATLDFARAEPLLKRFAEAAMPLRAVAAKALLFAHYPDGQNSDRLKLDLLKVVEDRNANNYAKHLAMEGLFARDWTGRDAWFLSLFRDPSFIHAGSFEPLKEVVGWNPDHWIPMVTKLIGNTDRTVHNNAVWCLVQFQNERARRDALEPLLPWLLDPQWSSARDRLRLIQSMSNLGLRESIPGLIAVLNQKVDLAERGYAAAVLGNFKEKNAVPALRQALASTAAPSAGLQSRGSYRRMFMRAMVDVGGLSDSETVAATEAYAALGAGAAAAVDRALSDSHQAPASDAAIMGHYLAVVRPLSESTVGLLLTRVTEIEPTEARTAKQLLELTHRWPSVAGDCDIARRIAANTAPAASIQAAFRRRDTFAANAAEALRAAASSTGVPAGMFAALSADSQRQQRILTGPDTAALRAVLAVARLAGDSLPLEVVERLYKSGDTKTERAAEAYLVSNDSRRAREVLNVRLKGTVILGAREPGEDPGRSSPSTFDQLEQPLLAIMKGDKAADEVFALLSYGYWSGAGRIVIERHGEAATLTYASDRADGNHRTLSPEEFKRLKAFVDSEQVDDFGPVSETLAEDAVQYEYVHLTRNSGRRVFINNLVLSNSDGAAYRKLYEEFTRLAR